MLNKVISITSGFVLGCCIMTGILQGDWGYIIPIVGAAIITYSNFTGFGE